MAEKGGENIRWGGGVHCACHSAVPAVQSMMMV